MNFTIQGIVYGGICTDQTGMNGNISAPPLFVDSTVDDFHLSFASPSIDTGDNTATNLPSTDFDGNTRIFDGDNNGTSIVDMGTDEFRPATPLFSLSGLDRPG